MEIMIYEIILHPACLLSLKFQTFLTASTTPGDNVFLTESVKIGIQTEESTHTVPDVKATIWIYPHFNQ